MITAKCVPEVLSGLDHTGHWPTNSSVIPPLGTEMVPYQSKQKQEPTKKKKGTDFEKILFLCF